MIYSIIGMTQNYLLSCNKWMPIRLAAGFLIVFSSVVIVTFISLLHRFINTGQPPLTPFTSPTTPLMTTPASPALVVSLPLRLEYPLPRILRLVPAPLAKVTSIEICPLTARVGNTGNKDVNMRAIAVHNGTIIAQLRDGALATL